MGMNTIEFPHFLQHGCNTDNLLLSSGVIQHQLRFSVMWLCAVIPIPRDDVKVAVLRLQVVPEDLPSQLDAPPLAGRAVGGAFHQDGPDGGLCGLQGKGVAIVAEQLQ